MTVLEAAAVLPEQEGVDRALFALVEEHLGADPATLPVLSLTFAEWQHVNVHLGLEACVTAPGRQARLVGMRVPQAGGLMGQIFKTPTLSVLLTMAGTGFGAAEYVNQPSGPGKMTACLATGLLLLDGPTGPVVVWVRDAGLRGVGVEVLAPSKEQATAFLDELKGYMAALNPFRGQFVRLSSEGSGAIRVTYEPRPAVTRDEVILPEGVLEALESHAIGITAQSERLKAAGRHLKRGVLFYGPPGTGKTHTLRYLASRLPEATLFVMTGSGMAWLDFIKEMAPQVAPAIVVLDDVDLIAEDRDLAGMSPRHMLFSLLDAMDGIREDADVLFVCTSNRADTLERAVAARPGRIDQAVEVGLPDHQCRQRLLDLYGKGIDLQLADRQAVIDRTEGVTASFIKELLRRAWLGARKAGSSTVGDVHVHTALDALLDPNNPLTPTLLGVREETIVAQAKQRGTGAAWYGI